MLIIYLLEEKILSLISGKVFSMILKDFYEDASSREINGIQLYIMNKMEMNIMMIVLENKEKGTFRCIREKCLFYWTEEGKEGDFHHFSRIFTIFSMKHQEVQIEAIALIFISSALIRSHLPPPLPLPLALVCILKTGSVPSKVNIG
jgi:hypothetical protein